MLSDRGYAGAVSPLTAAIWGMQAELEKSMLNDLADGNFLARNAIAETSRAFRSVTNHLSGLSAVWWANIAAPSPSHYARKDVASPPDHFFTMRLEGLTNASLKRSL